MSNCQSYLADAAPNDIYYLMYIGIIVYLQYIRHIRKRRALYTRPCVTQLAAIKFVFDDTNVDQLTQIQ